MLRGVASAFTESSAPQFYTIFQNHLEALSNLLQLYGAIDETSLAVLWMFSDMITCASKFLPAEQKQARTCVLFFFFLSNQTCFVRLYSACTFPCTERTSSSLKVVVLKVGMAFFFSKLKEKVKAVNSLV